MEASIRIIVLSFFYQHDRKTKCYLQQDPVNRRLCSCIQIFYRRCCCLLNVEKAGKAEASDQREVKQLWPTCIIVIEKSKKCITESECAQGSDFLNLFLPIVPSQIKCSWPGGSCVCQTFQAFIILEKIWQTQNTLCRFVQNLLLLLVPVKSFTTWNVFIASFKKKKKKVCWSWRICKNNKKG